jgi:hypothetical protein|tara:strand:- start:240 stop:479 length:240 start_codon:yes stop_codon:yes gene_type:complete
MAKQEPILTEKLRYDVSLYNSEYETKTVYKGATLKFLIDSLKKLDGNTKTNAKVGNTVKGVSTNSRNAKPNVNQHLKIK